MAGSTVTLPEAQAAWLGHPSHAEDFPAFSLETPGQSSLAFEGTSSVIFIVLR